MPAFWRSDRQRSWRATRWQPQPQNQRPNTAVARAAAAKKTSPALTIPSRPRAIPSDGSTGVTVFPAISQWAMWAAKTRWTAISTPIRQRVARERRMVVGRSWTTVRGTRRDYISEHWQDMITAAPSEPALITPYPLLSQPPPRPPGEKGNEETTLKPFRGCLESSSCPHCRDALQASLGRHHGFIPSRRRIEEAPRGKPVLFASSNLPRRRLQGVSTVGTLKPLTFETPSQTNFSLFSRGMGGRLGEEGRGDEGAHEATASYLTK